MKHDYRLPISRLTQLPKMKLFNWTGCLPLTVVYHSDMNSWRVVCFELLNLLMSGKAKSIDMSDIPTYKTAKEAIGGEINFV